MGLNINPADIAAPQNDFAPIPDGKYPVRVLEAVEEARTSKAGAEYEQVRFTFEICDGEHKRRRVWKNAIYSHPNDAASEFGLRFLRSLHTALGASGNITTDAFLEADRCVEAVLRTQPAKDGYPERQEVAFINVLKNQPACCSGEDKCGSEPASDPVDADDIF